MPTCTQLTIATSASCYLPSAGPQLDCPLGTGLQGSALAGACLRPCLVLEAPVRVLNAARFAQPSS